MPFATGLCCWKAWPAQQWLLRAVPYLVFSSAVCCFSGWLLCSQAQLLQSTKHWAAMAAINTLWISTTSGSNEGVVRCPAAGHSRHPSRTKMKCSCLKPFRFMHLLSCNSIYMWNKGSQQWWEVFATCWMVVSDDPC